MCSDDVAQNYEYRIWSLKNRIEELERENVNLRKYKEKTEKIRYILDNEK